MLCWIQVVLKVINKYFNYRINRLLCFFSTFLLFLFPVSTAAIMETYENYNGIEVERSIESLRDLDYQTWQVVVYPQSEKNDQIILRIVGFEGSLRIDHPTELEIHSGIKDWNLEDITLINPQLANDNRDAAVEFLLNNLLADLKKNRPLRLSLRGGFTELPIPPYVVNEWRSINSVHLENGN